MPYNFACMLRGLDWEGKISLLELSLTSMTNLKAETGGRGKGRGASCPLFSPAWSVGTFTIFVGTFGFVKNIENVDLKLKINVN